MPETYLWPVFGGIFVAALVLDLFVFQRKAHVIPVKEALKLVGFWVALALIFNVVIYFYLGHEKGILFTTSYLIEYSLSVDNLFVFLAIFTYFAVPREAQRKVLLWGILGAIFFRGIFIFVGITLIERFHFFIYLLGAFLIYTAIKLMTQKEIEVEPEKNPVVRFARKIIPVAPEYDGASFFKRTTKGLMYATPLIIVLVAIETMDIMFATDSVPAVLAVTTDPLIVYASNMFAILGLRALFFALAGLFYLFRYLSTGVCIVLAFVGVKMLTADLLVHFFNYQLPVVISLGVVIAILVGSVVASIILPKKEEAPALENPPKKEK